MKKLTAILSILFVIGLAHQAMVFAADAPKTKTPAKKNFSVKKKHAGTPAPAPSASPSPKV